MDGYCFVPSFSWIPFDTHWKSGSKASDIRAVKVMERAPHNKRRLKTSRHLNISQHPTLGIFRWRNSVDNRSFEDPWSLFFLRHHHAHGPESPRIGEAMTSKLPIIAQRTAAVFGLRRTSAGVAFLDDLSGNRRTAANCLAIAAIAWEVHITSLHMALWLTSRVLMGYISRRDREACQKVKKLRPTFVKVLKPEKGWSLPCSLLNTLGRHTTKSLWHSKFKTSGNVVLLQWDDERKSFHRNHIKAWTEY